MGKLQGQTKAFLLDVLFLPSDDARVVFLTEAYGRVDTFIPKLARSKKQRPHFDFLRLLEFQLKETKPDQYKISDIRSLENYAKSDARLQWLKLEVLSHTYRLGHELGQIFPQMQALLFNQRLEQHYQYEIDFWTHVLEYRYHFPNYPWLEKPADEVLDFLGNYVNGDAKETLWGDFRQQKTISEALRQCLFA